MQDDWRVTEPADAEPRAALRLRDAAHRALRSHELLRSGRALAARRVGAAVPRSARRPRVRRRGRQQPLAVRARSQQHLAAHRRRVRDQRQDGAARAATRTSTAASYQQANGTVGPFGFRTENLWVSTLDGITPFRLLRDPYPDGFRPSPGSSEGLLTAVGRRDAGAAARSQPDAVEPAVERHAAARAAVARRRSRSRTSEPQGTTCRPTPSAA